MGENDEKVETHERLTRVETKVDTVLSNHLPHIQVAINEVKEDVKRIDNRVWLVLGTIITGFLSTILLKLYK